MPLISKVGRSGPKVRLLLFGITGALWLGVLLHLFPVWWMFVTSIKPMKELFVMPPTLWPRNPTFIAYRLIFEATGQDSGILPYPMWVYLRNSFIITGGYVLLRVPVTAMAAYGVSKLQGSRWARITFLFFIGTLMIPSNVSLIPGYLLLQNFPLAITKSVTVPGLGWTINTINLLDTYWALIIPGAFGAFHFLIFKGFFDSVPNSIIHAARVDGGSEFNIFRRIVLPMCKPVFAVVGYFAFVGSWNNFLGPLLLLKTEAKIPVSLALYRLQQALNTRGMDQIPLDPEQLELMEQGLSWNGLMAMSLLESIPIIVAFIIFREFILKGIHLRGFK